MNPEALAATLAANAGAEDAGPPMPDKVPDAAEIKNRWRHGSDELIDVRRDYWLNKSFFVGNQHIKWTASDAQVRVIEFMNRADATTRRKINLFRNRTNSLHARLVKQDLEFDVEPPNAEQASLTRKSVQEHVLEGMRRSNGWEKSRSRHVQSLLFGGTSAICVEWDDSAKGILVYDPVTGQRGWIGGIKLTSLSIAEFCFEPGTREESDALWAIRATTLTTKQAQERFKLDKEPSPDADSATSATLSRSSRTSKVRPEAKRVMVYTYYQRPANGQPGCIVHVCAGHHEAHPWPYGFDRLPIFTGRQTQLDDTWVGDTLLSDARQVQMAYNDARTAIAKYVRNAANARIMFPAGALAEDDQLTDDTGETFEYQPSANGAKPEWFASPMMQRWLQEEPNNCSAELDEIFNTHAISRGQQVGDRNSGLALSILAEKDDTPLGPMAREQAAMWGAVGSAVLSTIRLHLPDGAEVTTSVKRGDVMVDKKWTKDDLDLEPIVHVPLDATSPKSTAAVRDEFTKIAQAFPNVMQAMNPDSVARVLDLSDLHDVFAEMNTDRAKALRENESLANGRTEIPDEWDEHPVHIVEHNRYRNSTEYESLPPDRRALVDAHVQAHEAMAHDDVAEQMPLPPDQGGPTPGGGAPAPDQGGPAPASDMPMDMPGMAPAPPPMAA